MAARIELVVSDLDGTLWDRSTRIAPATVAALDSLAAAGVPVLAATARRAGSARLVFESNGVGLLPAILLDGAVGRDLRDGSVFHRAAFDRASAQVVFDAFVTCGLEPCVNVVATGEDDAVLGFSPSTHPDHVAFIEPFARRADLVDVVASTDVVSFVLCGVTGVELEAVAARVAHVGAATVSVDHQYGGHCLSVRPPGVDKWAGVEAFCAVRGIDPGAVLAVGDGENDVELLTRAAVACAVSGGAVNAVAVADHVLAPAAEGGWAAVVDLVAG